MKIRSTISLRIAVGFGILVAVLLISSLVKPIKK